MSAVKYIILKSKAEHDASGAGKKFAVAPGGYKPVRFKAGTIDYGLDGTADYQVGSVRMRYEFVLKVPKAWDADYPEDAAQILAGYGDLDDLHRYFEANNPVGGANLVYLTNHYGTEAAGYLVGEMPDTPVTTFLDGYHAFFMITITFVQKEAIA
jgi:hypothetical protein